MNYLQRYTRASYKKAYQGASSRFTIDTNRRLDFMDPDPNNYAIDARNAMEYAINNSPSADTNANGTWYLAECNFNESLTDQTSGSHFPIYFPNDANGSPVTNELVAAPCPPFCQDDSAALAQDP